MKNNNLYFYGNIVIRKEYWGLLVLLGNGKRYWLDNKYHQILKKIQQNKHFDYQKSQEVQELVAELVEKGILTYYSQNKGEVKFVENKFVSTDCLSFPRNIYWETTRKCNFNCIHCYSSSGQSEDFTEIDWQIVKSMLMEMGQHGVEFLSLGGGEPILYSRIFDVIKLAISQGINVEMTTNGSLIDSHIIKKLKAAGLKFIQVSLDSIDAETYKKIRKNGNLKQTIENLEKMTQEFTVSVCMVVNKLNVGEIKSIIEFCKDKKVKFFRLIPLMEVGRGKEISKLQLTKVAFRKLYRQVTAIKKRKKDIFIQFNENLVLPERKNIEWMPENHFGCPAGRSTCGIDAFGNVYPCSFMLFDELNCGNVGDHSLSEIWRDSKVLKEIRNLDHLEGKCNNCRYLDKCRGGCRAAAFLKHHHLNDSDYLCSIYETKTCL